MQAFEQQMTPTHHRWGTQSDAVQRAHERLLESERQTELRQREYYELAGQYRARNRQERPTSRLAQARKHSALVQFRADPVTKNLPAWFEHYNGRQTIEAGIKENKQVFYLHHVKVRSEPAIYPQECFVIFAANFIRWASRWLVDQARPAENSLDVRKLGVKRQVQMAAHVSAR